MSSPVGTARVEIVGDLDQFARQTQTKLHTAMRQVDRQITGDLNKTSSKLGPAGGAAGTAYGSGMRKATTRGVSAVRSDVTSGLSRVSQDTSRAGGAAGTGFSGSLRGRVSSGLTSLRGHVKEQMKGMAGTIAGAFAVAKIGAFFSDSMAEAREAQKVGALTTNVIRSTGAAAGVTAGQVSDLAGQISKYAGIDDEAIQTGQNMLLTFTNIHDEVGKGNDIFDQATKIMTDMSAAMGTDMKGQAIQLGKALNDPIKGVGALSKVGVTFTQQQKDQIAAMVGVNDTAGAQRIILAELTKEFGGSAEAQATEADKLSVSMGNVKEEIGTRLMPVVDGLGKILVNDVLPAFSASVGFLSDNWHWLKYVAVAVLGMWAAYKGFLVIRAASTALAAFRGEMVLMTAAGAKFGTNLRGMATAAKSAFTPGTAAVVGLTAALAVGILEWQKSKAAAAAVAHDQAADVQSVTDTLDKQNGALTANTRQWLIKQATDRHAYDAAQRLGLSFNDVTDAMLGQKPAMDRVTAAVKDAIASGDDKTRVDGVILDQTLRLNGAVNQSRKSWHTQTQASKDASKQQDKTKDSIDKTTSSMKHQTTATDALARALDKLSGDDIGAAQAQLQFKDGLASAAAQVKENGRSLDDNTKKGRANREWLLDQISSVNDVANAQLKAGGSISSVTNRMKDNEGALRAAARAAHLNTDETDALIRKYAAVPSEVATKVSADTGQAWVDVNALYDKFARNSATLRVHITPDAGAIHIGGRAFGITAYDEGGLLPPGLSYVYNGLGHPEIVAPERTFAEAMDRAPSRAAVADSDDDDERVLLELRRANNLLAEVVGEQRRGSTATRTVGDDVARALQGVAASAHNRAASAPRGLLR